MTILGYRPKLHRLCDCVFHYFHIPTAQENFTPVSDKTKNDELIIQQKNTETRRYTIFLN